MKFTKSFAHAGTVLAFGLILLAGSVSAHAATVRVVHGIPGIDARALVPTADPDLPVDVYVNDAICLLSGFTFGEVAGPFTIPADMYNIKISLANTLAPCSNDAVIDVDVDVPEDSVSIVAHLTTEGLPSAAVFTNDLSNPSAGMSRLIAHHAANAPVVDLIIRGNFPGGRPVIVEDVANGAQAAAELGSTAATVGVAPAGSPRAIFVRQLLLKPAVTYLAYAVGSLANETFTIIVQPIGGLDGFTIRF
jgi:hypothetical protein